jgi:hypothetical protein
VHDEAGPALDGGRVPEAEEVVDVGEEEDADPRAGHVPRVGEVGVGDVDPDGSDGVADEQRVAVLVLEPAAEGGHPVQGGVHVADEGDADVELVRGRVVVQPQKDLERPEVEAPAEDAGAGHVVEEEADRAPVVELDVDLAAELGALEIQRAPVAVDQGAVAEGDLPERGEARAEVQAVVEPSVLPAVGGAGRVVGGGGRGVVTDVDAEAAADAGPVPALVVVRRAEAVGVEAEGRPEVPAEGAQAEAASEVDLQVGLELEGGEAEVGAPAHPGPVVRVDAFAPGGRADVGWLRRRVDGAGLERRRHRRRGHRRRDDRLGGRGRAEEQHQRGGPSHGVTLGHRAALPQRPGLRPGGCRRSPSRT